MSDLISRQAAIDALSQYPFEKVVNCVSIIEELPSAQPEPIKVSVDREMTEEELKELKKKIADSPVVLLPSAQPEYRMDEWCTDCKEYDHERHCCPRFNHVIRTTLQEVKEEQVEQKKGKWIIVTDSRGRHAECPYCGEWKYHSKQKFCGECGARMEEQE